MILHRSFSVKLLQIHIKYSQIVSLSPELKFGILELNELTAASNHIIHPSLDGLCAEISLPVSGEAPTFRLEGHKVEFAAIKLLMKCRLLVFVHPNDRHWVVLIDFKKRFYLVLEETLSANS